MEFLDEDTKPRFLFQSGAATAPSTTDSHSFNKPTKPLLALALALSLSSLLIALSLFFFQSEPFRSLLLWLSLSLLIGPFAPPSLTAGDIRVGRGPILHFPDQDSDDDDANKKISQRRSKSRRSDDVPAPVLIAPAPEKIRADGKKNENGVAAAVEEEKEWSEEDVDVLKKQMSKHPAGKPGRWEAIAAAFGGRHGAESVIKKAKELAEKKVDDSDSYAQFLKKRKPVDKRAEIGGNDGGGDSVAAESAWSSGEDIALLNALKAFPKDAPMRWEKVAAAVPGKSKAACVKRVAELKKGFRSAKAAGDG